VGGVLVPLMAWMRWRWRGRTISRIWRVAGGNVPLKNEPDAYLLPLGCVALAPALYGTSSSTSLVLASSGRVGVGKPP
jgi:hypothetical protein